MSKDDVYEANFSPTFRTYSPVGSSKTPALPRKNLP